MVSADVLLQTWERGRHGGTARRTLSLLAAALPAHDSDALASFDPGLSAWHLLRLRRAWFGAALMGETDCPACGEGLDIAIDATAIAVGEPPDPPQYTARDGRRFHLARIGDLVAVADADPAARASALFDRCSLDPSPAAGEDTLFDEIDAGLAALAGERTLRVDVSCALCGHRSEHALDPGEFLWTEIASAAAALLDDVHRLARAYGWPERDILAMSAARRAAYLSRVE